MDVDNKTLVIFLIGAIIISLIGAAISINRINDIILVRPGTGYATSGSGYVNITIAPSVAILLYNDTIYFGSCITNSTGYYLYSNETELGNPCTGNLTPGTADGIIVYNEGNVDANISLNATNLGQAQNITNPAGGFETMFLNSTSYNSTIYYSAVSEATSFAGGCYNFTPATITNWTNFSQGINQYHAICENLSYGHLGALNNEALTVYFRVYVPPGAHVYTNHLATMVFFAQQATSV
jgi:hypothetical protein